MQTTTRDNQDPSPVDAGFSVAAVESFVLSARPASPAKSALGDLNVRQGLLVRLTDREGAYGWGEVWCNFPPSAGRYRAMILADVLVPSIAGQSFGSPAHMSDTLVARWHTLAHHTGETGPFSNAIAGLDIAAWDLVARRAGITVAEAATGRVPSSTVPVYASTPNPDRLGAHVAELLDAGHDAIKLKVGYGRGIDDERLALVRAAAGPEAAVMVDANQIWSAEDACAEIAHLNRHRLDFVEEPIAGYLPPAAWGKLAAQAEVPVAGGENIHSDATLDELIAARGIDVFQPSITKFGGVTGTLRRLDAARAAGMRICPHYMGTALGLAASLQLLGLEPEPGRQELDANDNPLRTDLTDLDLTVRAGHVAVPQGPGLGLEPQPGPWLVD